MGPGGILESNSIYFLFREILYNRDDGKTCRNEDAEDDTRVFDPWSVFGMVQTQGLESALKSVLQVEAQETHAGDIEQHDPPLVESCGDPGVQIIDLIVTLITDLGQNAPLHLKPEIPHMDDQEKEDHTAQQGHVP